MKKFLTLVAGYAAGLAVAMKLRKDSGKSKLAGNIKDNTFGTVMDEIKDIHLSAYEEVKTAYEDVKAFVTPYFDDVKDFDGLKAKVADMVEGFAEKVESAFDEMKEEGEEKKELARTLLDDAYDKAEKTMEAAEKKAHSFEDSAEEKVKDWVSDAQKKLEYTYKKLKAKVDKMV